MDTSQPSAESSVPAHNNIVQEEAVGECCFEEVDSSGTMVGPSHDLKKPCHHQRKRCTANTPSSEMVFHKAGTRIGGGGGGTGGTDINDNHYGGHVEGVMCRRKAASFGLVLEQGHYYCAIPRKIFPSSILLTVRVQIVPHSI